MSQTSKNREWLKNHETKSETIWILLIYLQVFEPFALTFSRFSMPTLMLEMNVFKNESWAADIITWIQKLWLYETHQIVWLVMNSEELVILQLPLFNCGLLTAPTPSLPLRNVENSYTHTTSLTWSWGCRHSALPCASHALRVLKFNFQSSDIRKLGSAKLMWHFPHITTTQL